MINDKETIQLCIKACNEIDQDNPRIVRIKDTLHLEYIYVSEAMVDDVKKNPNLEIVSEPEALIFDEEGNLYI